MKGDIRKERSLASDQTSLPCSLVLEAWKAVPSRGLCGLLEQSKQVPTPSRAQEAPLGQEVTVVGGPIDAELLSKGHLPDVSLVPEGT